MISGLLTPAGGDSLDDADDCFHAFDGHVFEGTVVAVAARAEIWAGESHKAEFGAVGAAAHRVAYRCDVSAAMAVRARSRTSGVFSMICSMLL